jgi:hypothetical protein
MVSSSSVDVTKNVNLTTSWNEVPAASSARPTASKASRTCASTVRGAIPSSVNPTWPEVHTRSRSRGIRTAWL